MSLLSFGFILLASSNYDSYYWQARSAILNPESNNTKVNGVTVTKDFTTGKIVVRVNMSATNPTNYSGLTLDKFAISVFFLHTQNVSESVFQDQNQKLLANMRLDIPLGPRSTVSTNLFLNLNSTQSSSFLMFNRTYNGNVVADVVLHTEVSSFLDPVYGTMTTQEEWKIPVSWR